MASATPSGAPGLGGTGEEWEAFDEEEHYDGCSATHAAHHWDLGSLRMALAAGHSPNGITMEYPNRGPLHAACDTIKFCLAQMDGRVTFRVGKTEDDGVACVQVLALMCRMMCRGMYMMIHGICRRNLRFGEII